MLRDGLAYLQTRDYAVVDVTDAHLERPMTLYKGQHSLFRALAPHYRLNKAEFIQIYNLKPKTQVMLELIIEEVRRISNPAMNFSSAMLTHSTLAFVCGSLT